MTDNKLKAIGFTPCNSELPELGKLCIILLKDDSIIEAWRTESSFDKQLGYLYEDINTLDHYQKDVIAWKYIN